MDGKKGIASSQPLIKKFFYEAKIICSFLLALWVVYFCMIGPLASANASGFQLVGQIEGEANIVSIHNDYLFAGFGSKLVVFDVHAPEHPESIGSVMLSYPINQIKASKDHVFVTDAKAGFWIVDISDPSKVKRIGHYANVPPIEDFSVIGNYAYLSWRSKIGILDISDPGDIRLVGVWGAGKDIRHIDRVGDYLYVSSGSKVAILDVTDALAITQVGSINTAPIAVDYGHVPPEMSEWAIPTVVLVHDQILILRIVVPYGSPSVLPADLLVACDVSDPVQPVVIGEVDGDFSVADDGFAAGAKGACAPRLCMGSILSVYSLSDIQEPYELFSHYLDEVVNDIAIKAPFIYMADATGLWAVDINHPNFDSPIWSVGAESFWGVSAFDAKDILIASDNGLRYADFSNTDVPIITGPYGFDLSQGDSFFLLVPYLYTVNNSIAGSSSTFSIFDISDKLAQVEIDSLPLGSKANGLTIHDDKAFIASGTNGLQVVDVSVPSAPVVLSVFSSNNWAADDVAFGNGYLYVAAGSAGVRIIDVTDFQNMVERGSLSFAMNVRAVAAHGDALYVAVDSNLLRFDISDPVHPVQVCQYHVSTPIDKVSAADGLVFITSSGHIYVLADLTSAPNGLPGIIPFVVATGDFDGNGRSDLLRYDSQHGKLDIFLSQNGSFIKSDTLALSDLPYPDALGIGDFDGNGIDDVMWHEARNDTLVVYVSNGESLSRSTTLVIGSLGRPDGVAVGDFDGNGVDDVMWYEDRYREASFFTSDGSFLSSNPILSLQLPHPDALTAGQFDGQSGDDIMWYLTSKQRTDFYLSANTVFFRWDRMVFEGFGMPDAYAVGDYNGDGLDDILWYEAWDGKVYVFVSNGNYFVLDPGLILTDFPRPFFIASGDFDGNGKADILWAADINEPAKAWLSDGMTFKREPCFDIELFNN